MGVVHERTLCSDQKREFQQGLRADFQSQDPHSCAQLLAISSQRSRPHDLKEIDTSFIFASRLVVSRRDKLPSLAKRISSIP